MPNERRNILRKDRSSLQIPFTWNTGWMVPWTPFKNSDEDKCACYEWRDNYEFWDMLEFKCFSRGCSSFKFVFEDSEHREYEMFPSDVEPLIRDGTFGQNGTLNGVFTFCKRGSNYGIRYVRAEL